MEAMLEVRDLPDSDSSQQSLKCQAKGSLTKSACGP